MNYKSFRSICIEMTDEEYYSNDGVIHHSALSSFAKGGFDCLSTLFELKESESLLFGSCVDEILTGSMDSFNEKYYVGEFPNIRPEFANVVKGLFSIYKDIYTSTYDIPDNVIVSTMTSIGLYADNNWRESTKANKLRESGEQYYRQLYISDGKIMVSNQMYADVYRCIEALKNSNSTSFFFREDNPDEPHIERIFQPVFKETIDGITYVIKPDLLVVNHKSKRVIATDLKTTGKPEYKFSQSFIDWGYSFQSRLYYRIVRQAMDRDEYFKDFELTDWYFIVVNRKTLTPLVWEDVDTKTKGTIYYGKNNQIEVRDPFDVAKELRYYLDNNPSVPIGINIDKPNSLKEWLNKI